MTWRNTTGEHLGWAWKLERLLYRLHKDLAHLLLPLLHINIFHLLFLVTWEHPVPLSSTQIACTLWFLQTYPSAIYLLVTMWFVDFLPKKTFSPAAYKTASGTTLKFQCSIQQGFLWPFTPLTVVQPFSISLLSEHFCQAEFTQLHRNKRTWK